MYHTVMRKINVASISSKVGINIEIVQGLELKERLVSIPLPSTTMRHIPILKEEFFAETFIRYILF